MPTKRLAFKKESRSMVFLIMFMIGVTTAFIGSIAGLGGGVIFVPTMLFLAQVSSEFSWATPKTS